MNTNTKKAKLNLPKILSFSDYHQIKNMLYYVNEIIEGDKIKVKELEAYSGYSAIFYLVKDEKYKRLCKEYKRAQFTGYEG